MAKELRLAVAENGPKCTACAQVWPHKTPVGAVRFVCGHCVRFREVSNPCEEPAEPEPAAVVIPFLTLRHRGRRAIADQSDPWFENAVRLIEDREAA